MSHYQDTLAVSPVEDPLKKSLVQFLSHQDNRGHVNRDRYLANPLEYLNHNLRYALETIKRVKKDVPEQSQPQRILDLGCAIGSKTFALHQLYPNSEIYGLDPEEDAVNVAKAYIQQENLTNIAIDLGIGESLPYPDSYFDLITCHTVIEHVYDVEKVLSEIARVLKKDGVLHLDAPNYFWPSEPHLRIFCIPLLGKPLLKKMAKLQGQGHNIGFIDHLQLIHPWRVEKALRKVGLKTKNLLPDYVDTLTSGSATAKRYKKVIGLLKILKKTKIDRLLLWLVLKTCLYPMILLKATKS